jgi:hypothetical protein
MNRSELERRAEYHAKEAERLLAGRMGWLNNVLKAGVHATLAAATSWSRVMHEVLTNARKVLARNGSHDDVSEFRKLSSQVMEADFRAAVERLTGRRVVAFLGADRLEPDVAAEMFILDAPL